MVPRRHKFGLFLAAIAGWYLSGLIWPHSRNVGPAEWNSYAATISPVAASMAGLAVALTALVYALLGTPLLKFLHEKGALNRLLFDLMACAVFWLLALGFGVSGALPGFAQTQLVLRISTSAAMSGLLYFGPIGWAFWLLLRHAGDSPAAGHSHDFDTPTDLSS